MNNDKKAKVLELSTVKENYFRNFIHLPHEHTALDTHRTGI